ncbi:hypothetical protein [Shouchella lonarensis]|uniref:Phr family secreted Rap phosphatase inhibitor n=1 Tax=Shouchella lonarensis TaxID=1464122 RepID=A0A1G6IKF3_9BACI|nr:hypothetical protein [Shouchella lonarensis]SDC07009.1 hypothetical protein SAMN05421737_10595 [Shouchella lonarensis]
MKNMKRLKILVVGAVALSAVVGASLSGVVEPLGHNVPGAASTIGVEGVKSDGHNVPG